MQRLVSPMALLTHVGLAILLASAVAAFAQGPGPTAAKPATGGAATTHPSNEASLLVSADAVYAWTLDGDLQGMTSAEMHPKRIAIPKPGTHEIVITSPDGSVKIRKTVTVKAGEQSVVHFSATSIEVNGGALESGIRTVPTGDEKVKFDKEVEDMQKERQLQHPETFARVTPVSAYYGMSAQSVHKWQVNLMVASFGAYVQPKVQMAVKDSSGKWKPLPDGQPGLTPSLYQVLADDLGTEAAVCYTAKSELFSTPMRQTSWYSVQPGAGMPGRQMAFVASKPPTLVPASDAPCGAVEK